MALSRRNSFALQLVSLALGCRSNTPSEVRRAALAAPVAAAPSRAFVGASPVASTSASAGSLKVSRLLGRACALDEAGRAFCWASPTSLLTDSDGDALPRRVPELDGAKGFTKSSYFSYFLDGKGQIYVWGKRPHSYLGDVGRPKLLPQVRAVIQLNASGDMVYAVQADGRLMWWNDSFSSPEAGEPGTVVSNRPELAASNVQAVASKLGSHYLGRDRFVYRREANSWSKVEGVGPAASVFDCAPLSCAVDDVKRTWCWRPDKSSPAFELKGLTPVDSLGCASGADIYALGSDGSVFIGTSNFSPISFALMPNLAGVAELALCDGTLNCPHCVKLRSGVLSCWGQSSEKQLGTGHWPKDPQFVPLPAAVPGAGFR